MICSNRFVYFLMLVEMVWFLLISRGDVSRVLAEKFFVVIKTFKSSFNLLTIMKHLL